MSTRKKSSSSGLFGGLIILMIILWLFKDFFIVAIAIIGIIVLIMCALKLYQHKNSGNSLRSTGAKSACDLSQNEYATTQTNVSNEKTDSDPEPNTVRKISYHIENTIESINQNFEQAFTDIETLPDINDQNDALFCFLDSLLNHPQLNSDLKSHVKMLRAATQMVQTDKLAKGVSTLQAAGYAKDFYKYMSSYSDPDNNFGFEGYSVKKDEYGRIVIAPQYNLELDKFYELSFKIESEKDVEKKLYYCEESFKILPAVIKLFIDRDNALPSHILCRDTGPWLYMRLGRFNDARRAIQLCIDCNAYYPETGNEEIAFLNSYENAANIATDFIRKNPGFLQRKIYDALQNDIPDREALKSFIRNSYTLRKVRSGSTNELYIK